ncbi:hypothetical protein CROQUDRAFT_31030, partial [Cronartium quercuum f. sp. fusiforme G11]
ANHPPTYKEILSVPDEAKYRAVMEVEINKLIKQGFFKLVPKPEGVKAITS